VQSLTAERIAGADGRFAELRAERAEVVAAVESFRTGFDEARPTGSGDLTVRVLPSREIARPPVRTPRPGFDDEPRPMAILALDGHVRELDPACATVVGDPEHEVREAVWPSAHDRGAYREQQEQLRLLASGELESVRVRSTYMHGQGLMVPVTGRISAVRGEDGQPEHLLLSAEERASR